MAKEVLGHGVCDLCGSQSNIYAEAKGGALYERCSDQVSCKNHRVARGQAAQLRLRSLIDDASPAPGPVEVTTPAEEPRYVPGKPAAPPPAEPKPQNQNHWGWGAAVGALLAAVLALLGIKGVKAWRA